MRSSSLLAMLKTEVVKRVSVPRFSIATTAVNNFKTDAGILNESGLFSQRTFNSVDSIKSIPGKESAVALARFSIVCSARAFSDESERSNATEIASRRRT